MITAAAFVVVAAIGATVRSLASALDADRFRIPLGTLGVNLCGALALGLIGGWHPPVGTVVGTAGLGALTTFSTFSGQLVELGASDPPARNVYAAVSLIGGIAFAWLGLQLA